MIIILLAQTGLRASELTDLRCRDIHLGTGAHATTTGNGRKQRITPLTKRTTAVLRVWLAERGSPPGEPLFPASTNKPLSRKALARRIANHATHAAERCQSLTTKTITPHILRHTAAMRLLHADVNPSLLLQMTGVAAGTGGAGCLCPPFPCLAGATVSPSPEGGCRSGQRSSHPGTRDCRRSRRG